MQFWRQFDDDTLDQLVSDALTANHDLRIALGNLVEARGSRRESLYDLAPTVTAAGGYTKQLTPATEFGFPFSSSYYQAGFDATWELDFFGQVRRGIEARTAQVQGAQASLRDARVSVIAEVARTYFELRGQQTQLEVAQRNVVNETDTLKLTQARLVAGDFSCFRQGLFKRNSLHFAALHIGNSAPSLIVPSLIDRRVGFAVFGAQYPIDQIGDCVLGPIAGLFDDLICAQLHWLSLHRYSIPRKIVLHWQAKFGHLSTFVSQAARSASRIALTESSTSSSVVAQELTLIRMAARPLQVLPPHQHLPES